MKIEHAKLVRSAECLLPMAETLMARTCKSEALLEVRGRTARGDGDEGCGVFLSVGLQSSDLSALLEFRSLSIAW